MAASFSAELEEELKNMFSISKKAECRILGQYGPLDTSKTLEEALIVDNVSS